MLTPATNLLPKVVTAVLTITILAPIVVVIMLARGTRLVPLVLDMIPIVVGIVTITKTLMMLAMTTTSQVTTMAATMTTTTTTKSLAAVLYSVLTKPPI